MPQGVQAESEVLVCPTHSHDSNNFSWSGLPVDQTGGHYRRVFNAKVFTAAVITVLRTTDIRHLCRYSNLRIALSHIHNFLSKPTTTVSAKQDLIGNPFVLQTRVDGCCA
jgi:hypothetical protein